MSDPARALNLIAGQGCSRIWSKHPGGARGACFREGSGLTPDAPYTDDRCCDQCIAWVIGLGRPVAEEISVR